MRCPLLIHVQTQLRKNGTAHFAHLRNYCCPLLAHLHCPYSIHAQVDMSISWTLVLVSYSSTCPVDMYQYWTHTQWSITWTCTLDTSIYWTHTQAVLFRYMSIIHAHILDTHAHCPHLIHVQWTCPLVGHTSTLSNTRTCPLDRSAIRTLLFAAG